MAKMLPGDAPTRFQAVRARWANIDPTTRLVVLGMAVMLVTALGGLGMLLTRPDMRPVVSGVDAKAADQVVQKLDEMKITYRLTDGGQTVLVPAADLYRARLELAGSGVTEQGRPGFEIFDKINLHSSDFAERVNYMRALTGELESTIRSIPSVKNARVHLNIPKDAVFLDDQTHPTASVLLELQPGQQLSRTQAQGIRNLVAASVDGLKPEEVSLMDTTGKLLMSDDQDGMEMGGEEEQISKQLQRTAQGVLDGVLGPGHSMASVRVEFLRDRRETRSETVQPGAEKSRKDAREAYLGSKPAGVPTPGASPSPALTNQNTGTNATDRPNYDQTSSEVEYDLSRKTETVVESPTKIRRLTASVLVDSGVKLSPDALTSLSDALKLALGLDEARGDKFELTAVAFNRTALDEEKAAMEAAARQAAADQRFLIMAGAGTLGGLCLFGLAGLLLGRSKKRRKTVEGEELTVTVHGPEKPALTGGTVDISLPAEGPSLAALPHPSHDEMLLDARRQANDTPAIAARLIQMWLEEDKRR